MNFTKIVSRLGLLALAVSAYGMTSAESRSDIVFDTHGSSTYTKDVTYPGYANVKQSGHCVDTANTGKCGPEARPRRTFQRSSVGSRSRFSIPFWRKDFYEPNTNVVGWENSSYAFMPARYVNRASSFQYMTRTAKDAYLRNQGGKKVTVYDRYPEIFQKRENQYTSNIDDYLFSVPGMYLPHHAAMLGIPYGSQMSRFQGFNLYNSRNVEVVDMETGETEVMEKEPTEVIETSTRRLKLF